MSINFSQFPTPRLPLVGGDMVVGYQIVGGIPTLAQYTLTQLFVGAFPGGVVPVSQGGTGQSTLTVNGVLIGEGTNPINAVTGVTGQMLLANTGSDPAFGNNPTITGGTISAGAVINQTTQGRLDNTTLVATDAFVNQQIASATATVPIPLTSGIYNQATLGTGTTFVIFATGGVISSILTVVTGGTGYVNGDLLIVVGGNSDALLRVTNAVGGVIQSGGLSVLYGGTGYTTGATVGAVPAPPGQRSVVLTGVLSGNVTFIIQNGTFLTASRRVQFNNNTTGAFTVTVKLSNGAGGTVGTGVVLPQGTNNSTAVLVQTDGVNDVWLAETAAGIGALSTSAGFGRLLNIQVITSTQTYTATATTTKVVVEVQAAGGGSAGAPATTSQAVGGSGAGAGAYAKVLITSGFSGVTATVGAAGTAGGAGTVGGAGGTASFGALVSCPGGSAGGLGGVAGSLGGNATGAAKTAAPTLGAVTSIVSVAGQGSSACFALSATQQQVSPGGSSPLGYGGCNPNLTTSAGVAGTGFGAGAAAPINTGTQSASVGTAGQPGVIIVYEYA